MCFFFTLHMFFFLFFPSLCFHRIHSHQMYYIKHIWVDAWVGWLAGWCSICAACSCTLLFSLFLSFYMFILFSHVVVGLFILLYSSVYVFALFFDFLENIMKKFPTTTATPLETAEWNKSFLYESERKKMKKERQIVKI